MNSLRQATMSVAFLFSIAVMGIAIVPCIELVAVRSGIAAVGFFNQLPILSTSEWIALASSFVIVVLLAKIAHTLSKINIALHSLEYPRVAPTSLVPFSVSETRTSNRVLEAAAWLKKNPEHAGKTTREIEAISGFSRSTVSRANQYLKSIGQVSPESS